MLSSLRARGSADWLLLLALLLACVVLILVARALSSDARGVFLQVGWVVPVLVGLVLWQW